MHTLKHCNMHCLAKLAHTHYITKLEHNNQTVRLAESSVYSHIQPFLCRRFCSFHSLSATILIYDKSAVCHLMM